MGNARVESDSLPDGGNQITRVTTYNRLVNHRSILCEVNGYIRPDLQQLAFISDASARTIDFCFDTPSEPVYPEGIVVALLRGTDEWIGNAVGLPPERRQSAARTGSQEHRGFALQHHLRWQPVVGGAHCDPGRLVHCGAGRRARGSRCAHCPAHGRPTPIGTSSPSGALWCGRERVRIETRIILNGEPRDLGWMLISVRPDVPSGGVFWRVQEVELL